MPAELLMVVEVAFDDRIRCQAPGCARSVHKRIHVVRDDGHLLVMGSECFERLYGRGNVRDSGPRYGTSEGRVLTQEEREMLAANTEAFIAYIEAKLADVESKRLAAEEERAAEVQRRLQACSTQEAQRRAQASSPAADRKKLAQYRAQQITRFARAAVVRVPALAQFPLTQVERAMVQARVECVASGVQLDAPGSLNLVEAAALSILLRSDTRSGPKRGGS